MASCEICGLKIGNKNLKEVFRFTLGNRINGKFYGKKTLYYHVECLNGKKCTKQSLLVQVN